MAHLPPVTSLIIDVSVFVRQCLFNCNVWIPSLQDGLDQTFLKPLSYQNTSFSGRWQFQCKILSCFSRQYLTHAVFVFFSLVQWNPALRPPRYFFLAWSAIWKSVSKFAIYFTHCEFSLKISSKKGNDNNLFDLFTRRAEYVKIDVTVLPLLS